MYTFIKCYFIDMSFEMEDESSHRSEQRIKINKPIRCHQTLYSIGYPQYRYKINVYNGVQNIYSLASKYKMVYKENQYIL